MFLTLKDTDRFLTNVRILGEDDCWFWRRCCDSSGYGLIWLNGRREGTHRVAWFLTNGPIPELFEGLPAMICHSCDRPSCCNPAHLFLGNNKSNQEDSIIKGRHSSLRKGEDSPKSVVTEAQAEGVKQFLKRGFLQKEIAVIFNITSSTVSNINTGRFWRGV